MSEVQASIIVTCFNEATRIDHLLDSLLGQATSRPFEVIVVDARSLDGTGDVVAKRAGEDPRVRLIRQACKRGEGRNIGVRAAQGELFVFIDADCIANAFWLEHLLAAHDAAPGAVLAGETRYLGFWSFTRLHRVELPRFGLDTTWPSCNLAYPRAVFDGVGGFDNDFVTAEDIDLNYRAIGAGATIDHVANALVYAHARDSIGGFLKQAYWNGYGRKQLTAKHGDLWAHYNFLQLLRLQGGSIWGIARMAAGAMGYIAAKLRRTS